MTGHPLPAPLNAPYRLSHGTLECRSLVATRPFYEEFLGFDCVRHGRRSMLLRKGGYWAIVCVEAGDKIRPQGLWNHWGLDLESKEAVDDAHGRAHEFSETYGIDKITQPGMRHGTYQFHFRDQDGNWWEFQFVEKDRYDQFFEQGDTFNADGTPKAESNS